jgi:signal transduction histidine kinase
LELLSRCLKRLRSSETAKEATGLLAVAKQEVDRLDSIVSNFLQAVRSVPPRLEHVVVTKVLAEALGFMRREIEDRNILVEASLPEQVPPVMADAGQLKQAFYNIIRNAIQAMPDGGLLQIECAVRDDFLHIRFADTGKGISREDMSRLMEPYFTTRADGTGLGLLIVERIVRAHGGVLGIDSDGHTGSAFTVRLPLRERQVRLLRAGLPDASPADAGTAR